MFPIRGFDLFLFKAILITLTNKLTKTIGKFELSLRKLGIFVYVWSVTFSVVFLSI